MILIRFRADAVPFGNIPESFEVESGQPIWDVNYAHRLVDRLDALVRSGRLPRRPTGNTTS
jgi:hypothetical protein